MDIPNESNMTFKEAVAVMTNANCTLLEQTRMLAGKRG